MKNLTFALLLAIIPVFAIAQNQESRNLPSFSKLSVGQSIKLVIEKGNENRARIETSGVDAERVLTEVSGSTLDIRMKKGTYRSTNVNVYLTYKDELEAIDVNSSSSLEANSIVKSNELDVKVSSSAKMEADIEAREVAISVSSSARANLEVSAQSMDVSVNSSGKLELSGSTEFHRFRVSSSGKLMAFGLNCEKVKADISSSGNAEIYVSEELIADASSSGKISYRGNPEKVLVDTSSSGKVRKAD